jgi:UDP-glucose 4-epimerase
MSRYLIIGGSGFLGFHLSKFLIENKHKVVVVDNFSRGKKDYDLTQLSRSNDFKLINIDFTKKESVKKIKYQYDYIVNFAAIVGVKHVLKNPFDVLVKNFEIHRNVIELCKKQKRLKRLLFTSTSEVYYGSLKNKLIKFPTPENNILTLDNYDNYRSTYMLSKLYCEALTGVSNINYTIVRPHNIYGPRMGMSHVIPELIKKINFLKLKKMSLMNGNHTRTFCYVDDAVKMIYFLMKSNNANKKIFNIGNNNPEITILKLSKIISKILKKKIRIKSTKSKYESPSRRRPDTNKMNKIIKDFKKTDLNEGILKTYLWYKKNNK